MIPTVEKECFPYQPVCVCVCVCVLGRGGTSLIEISLLHNCVYANRGGGVGHDRVNIDFADSALLLPLHLYGEKRRQFCWANKICRALL